MFGDSTDLAGVPSCQAHQRREPVSDVEKSFGDSPPASQQGAVHKGQAADSALPVRPLTASQGPVAASCERLRAVVRGEDDDAVLVVAVLPEGVGDVSHRLVHGGHHGGELPPGDISHGVVGVDVGLGRLEWSVDGLETNTQVLDLSL